MASRLRRVLLRVHQRKKANFIRSSVVGSRLIYIDAEDTDDDILMPDGPPPGASREEEEEDTDDDIPMADPHRAVHVGCSPLWCLVYITNGSMQRSHHHTHLFRHCHLVSF